MLFHDRSRIDEFDRGRHYMYDRKSRLPARGATFDSSPSLKTDLYVRQMVVLKLGQLSNLETVQI